MRQIWTITLGLFFCATLVNAQTLGQVAEKERVRRAKLWEKHVSAVVTEAQFGSGRVDARDADAAPLAPEGASSVPESSLLSAALDYPAESAEADPWAELFEGYQVAYRNAKEMLSDAEAFKSYCDGDAAPPERPGFVGWYWTVDCASMPAQVAKAEQSTRDIETACHNHARRLRVPPGRARLH